MIVAPVLSELLLKLTAEEQQVERYTNRIQEVIDQVVRDTRRDKSNRPRKVGLAELEAFAEGLDGQINLIGTVADQRRKRIVAILEDLRGHATGTDLIAQDVLDAFAEEERLRQDVDLKEKPGRPDLLVLSTVERCQKARPGIFLTCDRLLRDLAEAHKIRTEDPEAFANAP